MRAIGDTISRLAAFRERGLEGGFVPNSRLEALGDSGSNPGALKGWFFAPDDLPSGAPLVVVLHGCTQDAAGYDLAAGWSQLAEEAGFALLFPEQRRTNNANLCFNWFEPADIRRGGGEALSIKQMVDAMVARFAVDRARIFVTGLSAGGAMTSVMLATYPDVFAGGAIIAGLPFACARSVPEAFDRMRGHGLADAADLTGAVRAASSHDGPWPSVSVWHGTSDATVLIPNADACVAQWTGIHGLPLSAPETDRIDGQARRIWRDRDGKPVVEEYRIAGMGHGTPLATTGPDACGSCAPYMLEAGISSTRHIARFWGIAAAARTASAEAPARKENPRFAPASAPRERGPSAAKPVSGTTGVGKVIEDALRAAGLMR